MFNCQNATRPSKLQNPILITLSPKHASLYNLLFGDGSECVYDLNHWLQVYNYMLGKTKEDFQPQQKVLSP